MEDPNDIDTYVELKAYRLQVTRADVAEHELDKYQRALAVAKEGLNKFWSGNSEDFLLRIDAILNE